MGHIERRQKEKENLKKSILNAALDIAISEGWNAVTIRRIADAIKYTPPIVYEYFKNKEDLLTELSLMGHRMLNKEYDLARKVESDPKKTLILLSFYHWDFAFKHKKLYQLMFRNDRPLPNEEVHSFVRRIRDLFFELTNDEELAEEQMFSWMCLLQGFIYSIKQKGLPPQLKEIDPKDLYARAMERFISNI